jgi:CDP-diacylglycerol--glycerol-3-phosphate 3-phosphatidyltransferase
MDDGSLTRLDPLETSVDLAFSCGVLLVVAMVAVGFAFAAMTHGKRADLLSRHRSIALPQVAGAMMHWALDPLVRVLLAADVSANAVTGCSLVAGGAAGVALALGHFGVAAALLVVASLGDALDGLVARGGHGESPAGALFDASVDRYEEFFSLGGIAIYFRESGPVLGLVLAAMMGSFMVSYGSAKAEALRVPVPVGAMRRAERATCLCLGTTLAPLAGAVARASGGPSWASHVPVIAALAVIAGAANISAVRRMRVIAAHVTPPRSSEARAKTTTAGREPGARVALK